jgi:hypothetical protein
VQNNFLANRSDLKLIVALKNKKSKNTCNLKFLKLFYLLTDVEISHIFRRLISKFQVQFLFSLAF